MQYPSTPEVPSAPADTVARATPELSTEPGLYGGPSLAPSRLPIPLDAAAQRSPESERDSLETILGETPLAERPTPEPRTVTSSNEKASPIALALRDEIRLLAEEETLTLEILGSIASVARTGRTLLAARNPLMRFDAQTQGLSNQPSWADPFDCGAANPYAGEYGEWNGPTVRGVHARRQQEILEALRDSPLARAIRDEILQVTTKETFDASNLLEIEQLATSARTILASAMGLHASEGCSPQRARYGYGGAIIGGNPMAYSGFASSPETYGATVLRELGALANKKPESDPEKLVAALAKAREKGLDDVAKHLEGQLGIEADEA